MTDAETALGITPDERGGERGRVERFGGIVLVVVGGRGRGGNGGGGSRGEGEGVGRDAGFEDGRACTRAAEEDAGGGGEGDRDEVDVGRGT